MTKPAYTIGKDEMLLITVRWNDGDTVLLETPVKFYTAADIQSLIDETVSERCDVISVDLYDFKRRVGQDISDEFDVRPWSERVNDERRSQATIYDARVFGTDEAHDIRRDNVAMFKPRSGLGAVLVRGANLQAAE
ncbi:hypothetical protein ACQZ5N_03390 [Agrobacterium sp. 22-221-1]|nr:hypothetical protein FY137_07080 [Agrobacterium tumefaciens]